MRATTPFREEFRDAFVPETPIEHRIAKLAAWIGVGARWTLHALLIYAYRGLARRCPDPGMRWTTWMLRMLFVAAAFFPPCGVGWPNASPVELVATGIWLAALPLLVVALAVEAYRP